MIWKSRWHSTGAWRRPSIPQTPQGLLNEPTVTNREFLYLAKQACLVLFPVVHRLGPLLADGVPSPSLHASNQKFHSPTICPKFSNAVVVNSLGCFGGAEHTNERRPEVGFFILGGSWLVISGVLSTVTILITHTKGLITPLITTHEPPSALT